MVKRRAFLGAPLSWSPSGQIPKERAGGQDWPEAPGLSRGGSLPLLLRPRSQRSHVNRCRDFRVGLVPALGGSCLCLAVGRYREEVRELPFTLTQRSGKPRTAQRS